MVVHEKGFELDACFDLFVRVGDDAIALTIKGIQLLKYAGAYWKVPVALGRITTEEQLFDIAMRIQDACIEKLENELKAEQIRFGLSPADRALNARFRLSGISELLKDANT